jgi:hypothetical protein
MKKTRKNMLRSSAAMLLVSALALTTATYAWFTTGDTGTVGPFTLQAVESNGIQLSADAVNWKTTITKDDLNGKSNNQFPTENVNPLSSTGAYANGVMDLYSGSVDANTGTFTATKANDSKDCIKFDFYVKNDGANSVKLNLTANSSVTDKTSGKEISKASRVAFIYQGYATIAQIADGKESAITGQTSSSGTAQIWEPNPTTNVTTKAINTEITGGSVNSLNVVTDSSYVDDQSTSKAPIEIVTIPKEGVVKITVYVWFEGQDIDCKSSYSNGDIEVKLQFKGEQQTT